MSGGSDGGWNKNVTDKLQEWGVSPGHSSLNRSACINRVQNRDCQRIQTTDGYADGLRDMIETECDWRCS